MKSPQFTIGWVYDEFFAARMSGGKIVARYTAAFDVNNLMDFNVALVEAGEAIGMDKGGEIGILHESEDHAHVFLDLPPMPSRDLERLLERRAAQEKPFEAEAVWSYRPVSDSLGGHGVLLHLLPSNICEAILRICEENHATPTQLLSLADVIAEYVHHGARDSEEIILIVALFKTHVELVVSDGNGNVLFERNLNFDWHAEGLERLKTDIDRTLLYVKQRQHIVGRIVFMGSEAEPTRQHFSNAFQLPVESETESEDPGFWLKAVSASNRKSKANLVPSHLQHATRRRHLLRATTWLAAACVICTLTISAGIEYLRWQQNQADPGWLTRLEALQNERDALIAEHEAHQALRAELNRISPQSDPLPAKFFIDLGKLVPPSAVLSKAEFRLQQEQWAFAMTGASRPTMADAAGTLEGMSQRLTEAPWLAHVDPSWRDLWLEKLRAGGAANPGLVGFEFRGVIE